MKSILAIGIIACLPLLALFTAIHFGIHKMMRIFNSGHKALMANVSSEKFNHETVSAQ